MQDFVHLHVHTYYSILDGLSPIAKLVDKAVADGMRGMAITDHGNMFGVKEFFDYCAEKNRQRAAKGLAPFKPVFGCEMYVARRGKENKEQDKGDGRGYHLVVLAKNETGYHNLMKLVSRAWVDGRYYTARTDRADLETYREGLIVCSACLAGEVASKILDGDIEGARKAVEWHKSVWGDDYYLELQRHPVTDLAQEANRETYPRQQQVNKALIELAKEYGIKLVCTNDCHFVNEDDAEAHDHLICVSTERDLADPNRMRYSKQEWFKTRQEMNSLFADVPEALANTCEVLDKVEIYDINHAPIMPNFPIPESFGTEEEWRKKFSSGDLFREFTADENGENPLPEDEANARIDRLGGYEKLYRIKFEADYLATLAYAGAKKIYGEPLLKEVDERLRFELHVMKTMGFPGYFLIVQDFINAARNELGVWVGPGRGSAAGSVVAYCLGITRLDPFKYGLLFERFLNPDRISLPDIDTDFDDDGRGRVLQYVMKKYGADNCAHIITFSTMQAKNALRDVARLEKVPRETANAWCKAIPKRLPNKEKITLDNVLRYVPVLREAAVSPDKRVSNTILYARKLEGTVRGTGIHACGFIICRDPITDHVPVSTADDPDFPNTKTTLTQYVGELIESTGLIKMDFLGLKTLSELKEAVKNVKLSRGIDIDINNIPIDDEETYKLYQRGQTIGTFQFESPGMQKYLRQLQPTVFEDLIAMNALYRPGPMEYIPQFIARKNGDEQIVYDLPVMETYLKETYGITVYQEQVMLLSRLLADFTRGESDALRKAMGKKKKKIVDQMKPKFIEGGKRNGHDPKVLEKIWADWEKFAEYAFNKSHAACYSWVSYQTAYLKAHYPAEFMAAIMTRRKNDISEITKLMDECRAMNIATLGPDVNESFANFGVNARGEIRFGLAAIKGMGTLAADAIIEERQKNGPFKDLRDFMQRVNISIVNRKGVESLALSGALDCFGIDREQYLAPMPGKDELFLDALIRFAQTYQRSAIEAESSLFGFDGMSDFIAFPAPPAKFARWSVLERLNRERELVGIYLSAHPLDEYSVVLHGMCNTHPSEFDDSVTILARRDITMGGIVTEVSAGLTKTGKQFGIVKIEDYEGQGELRLFNDWPQWKGYFVEGALLFISGTCEAWRNNSARFDFKINRISYLHDVKEKEVRQLTIALPEDVSSDDVSALLAAIGKEKGSTSLVFKVRDPQTHSTLHLRAKNTGINPSHDLITFLEMHDGLAYRVN